MSFLPPLILQLIMVGYLLRLPHKSKATWRITGWLACLTLMVGAQFAAYTIYAPISTYINWIGGTVPSLLAVTCFIQFAYHFPRFVFKQEARKVLLISALLLLSLIAFMTYEATVWPGVILYNFEQFTYDMVSEHNQQPFNSPLVFFALYFLGYVWALSVWIRMGLWLTVTPDSKLNPLSALRLLGQLMRRPANQDARIIRAFILYMVVAPLSGNVLFIEVAYGLLPPGTFAATYLLAIFSFALLYINNAPEPSTMMVKVVGISLLTLLTITTYLNAFVLNLRLDTDEQRRHGEVAQVQTLVTAGKATSLPADVVYLASRPATDELFSTEYGLLFSQNPELQAAQFNQEDASLAQELRQNLIVPQRAAFHQFSGLPVDPSTALTDLSMPIFRGVYAGPPDHYLRYLFTSDGQLYEIGYSYSVYRQRLHETALPLVYLTGGATLLILIVFPLFFRINLLNPLSNLLDGVRRIDKGNLQVQIPVGVNDEIGFLTQSFNRMAASLRTLNRNLRHEIVERRQAEEAALASEQRFRFLFDYAPLSIFEIDVGTMPANIRQANRQTEVVYGWPRNALDGMPLEQLLPTTAAPPLLPLVDPISPQQTFVIETTHRRRDGTLFPVRMSITPQPLPGTKRLIVTVQDITIEKQRRSQVEAITEDRRRIAREMHDSLAQTLAGLRLRARLWQKLLAADPAQLHPELDEMRTVLDHSIVEVRRSIFALRPVNLEELGFFPALRQFVDDFSQQYQLEVHLDVQGPENRFPNQLELDMFRVIQEALNNVGKHAQATTIWITVNLTMTHSLALTICDDGQGFDPKSLDAQVVAGHIGLKQMRERVESLNGSLLLYSQPDEGTRLETTIPFILSSVSP